MIGGLGDCEVCNWGGWLCSCNCVQNVRDLWGKRFDLGCSRAYLRFKGRLLGSLGRVLLYVHQVRVLIRVVQLGTESELGWDVRLLLLSPRSLLDGVCCCLRSGKVLPERLTFRHWLCALRPCMALPLRLLSRLQLPIFD